MNFQTVIEFFESIKKRPVRTVIIVVFMVITLGAYSYYEGFFHKKGEIAAAEEPSVKHSKLINNLEVREFISTGIASISHQCNELTESPCPQRSELIRRAIEVAKIYALKDLSIKAGVNIDYLSEVSKGKISDETIVTRTNNIAHEVNFIIESIENDRVTVKAAVKINN